MQNNIPFIKMHGLGNDFIIIDRRNEAIDLEKQDIKLMADRHFGIGCDQLVVLDKPEDADINVSFYNADGSSSAACGNATRCIAWLIMQESGKDMVIIKTSARKLICRRSSSDEIAVDMGTPLLEWHEIPLSKEQDTLSLDIAKDELANPVAVNMGNPHAVFVVKDVDKIDLAKLGPYFESHEIFPERANIGVLQVISKSEIKLRVFERGSGETLACGSGACAAVVAARLRGLVNKEVVVNIKGGKLTIILGEDGHVWMEGPVKKVFKGVFLK